MCVCYYGVCTSPGVLVNRAKEYMNVYTVCTYLHTHVHIHIKEHTRTQFISISTSHCIYWNLWLYTDTSNSNPTLWQVCCNSAFHVCQTPSMTVTNLAPCTCNQPCSECSPCLTPWALDTICQTVSLHGYPPCLSQALTASARLQPWVMLSSSRIPVLGPALLCRHSTLGCQYAWTSSSPRSGRQAPCQADPH